ncbi:MAG: histidine phosphatase family protein [Acidimicrobiales bacterium]
MLSATRMVLVRHGEAVCNVEGIVGGLLGCSGLTDRGRAQVRALERRLAHSGELVSCAALYSSSLARARETALIIAPALGPGVATCLEDCALCELHPGDADGLTWERFAEAYGEPDWDRDPTTPIAPGGESWSGFVDRAADTLTRIAAAHRGAMVVVVCHAGVIEAALLRLLPIGSGAGRLQLRTEHASLTEFEYHEGQWRLLRYNDAAHLLGPSTERN